MSMILEKNLIMGVLKGKMPKEKYYFGKVSSKKDGSTHSLMIYDNTLQLLTDAAKAIFSNDPLYSFEEEISEEKFKKLEKIIGGV